VEVSYDFEVEEVETLPLLLEVVGPTLCFFFSMLEFPFSSTCPLGLHPFGSRVPNKLI